MNLAKATGHLAPWLLRLCTIDFDLVPRAVINHRAADALSRYQTTGADTKSIDENLPALFIDSDSTDAAEVRLENNCQTPAQVNESNSSSIEKAASWTVKILQH